MSRFRFERTSYLDQIIILSNLISSFSFTPTGPVGPVSEATRGRSPGTRDNVTVLLIEFQDVFSDSTKFLDTHRPEPQPNF